MNTNVIKLGKIFQTFLLPVLLICFNYDVVEVIEKMFYAMIQYAINEFLPVFVEQTRAICIV
jgi:hypothetical protein